MVGSKKQRFRTTAASNLKIPNFLRRRNSKLKTLTKNFGHLDFLGDSRKLIKNLILIFLASLTGKNFQLST